MATIKVSVTFMLTNHYDAKAYLYLDVHLNWIRRQKGKVSYCNNKYAKNYYLLGCTGIFVVLLKLSYIIASSSKVGSVLCFFRKIWLRDMLKSNSFLIYFFKLLTISPWNLRLVT